MGEGIRLQFWRLLNDPRSSRQVAVVVHFGFEGHRWGIRNRKAATSRQDVKVVFEPPLFRRGEIVKQ